MAYNHVVSGSVFLDDAFDFRLTPESINRDIVNDGSAPCTALLQAAIDYADTNGKTLFGKNGAVYLIDDAIDLKDINFDFSNSIIKFDADIGTANGDIIISSGNGNSLGNTTTRSVSINIDGNRSNQTYDLIAFNLRNDHSPNSDYMLKTFNCYHSLLIDGDAERNNVTIYAALCDYVVEENPNNGGTPDDNNIKIYGGSCKQWYKNAGQISSTVEFAVENNVSSDVTVPAVYLASGKATTLRGEIRGTYGDCIYLHDAGSTGHVTFNDLNIIQVKDGWALKMVEVSSVSGNLYIENIDTNTLTYDGTNIGGILVDSCQDASSCHILIGDCRTGTPVDFRDVGGSGYSQRTVWNFTVPTRNQLTGEAIVINTAQDTHINMYRGGGDIRVESGGIYISLEVDMSFIGNNRSVIDNTGATRLSCNVKGMPRKADVLANTSWAFKGCTIEMVDGTLESVWHDNTNWIKRDGTALT